MKKNVMMRLASFLLIAVLISTSAISGTYAKYVTEGTSRDSAHVAKWGVKVIAKGDMFELTYATDDADYTALYTNSVISNTTGNLVAPGTSGSFVETTLTGSPEVAVEVTYAIADLTLTGWEVDGVYYCPIIITVEGKKVDGSTYTTVINGLDYTNTTAFKNAIAAAVANYKVSYPANTDLSTVAADALDIDWAWNFEVNEGAAQWQSDIKDTALGDAAAAGNAAVIDITVKTTVTQID